MLIVRRLALDTHRPSLRCDELEAMLIYSMSVSVDGFIADREGAFEWSAPSEELFRFHLAQVGAPAWPRRRSSSASSTSCACSAIRSSSVAARRSYRRSPKTSAGPGVRV